MDILNIIFGLVTILSFGYAIWANRTLQSVQSQRNRAISSIRDIAYRLQQLSPESSVGGASYSIMRICDSLVPPNSKGQVVGRLRLDYPPWEQPPMHTHGGCTVQDPRTRLGLAWESIKNDERPRFYAVFGPYHTLPVLGRYNVTFKICLVDQGNPFEKALSLVDQGKPLQEDLRLVNKDKLIQEYSPFLRLDAYAYIDGKTILSEKFVKSSELSSLEYREFCISFDYSRAGQVLEFRVELLVNEIKVRVSDIRVEYNTLI
jgi:hypothetical protein